MFKSIKVLVVTIMFASGYANANGWGGYANHCVLSYPLCKAEPMFVTQEALINGGQEHLSDIGIETPAFRWLLATYKASANGELLSSEVVSEAINILDKDIKAREHILSLLDKNATSEVVDYSVEMGWYGKAFSYLRQFQAQMQNNKNILLALKKRHVDVPVPLLIRLEQQNKSLVRTYSEMTQKLNSDITIEKQIKRYFEFLKTVNTRVKS